MIKRLFVANRGEIALRVIGAAKALNIETVIGVSEADVDTLFARAADRVVELGPAAAAKSYLDPALVVHAAIETGCDALHPGYGFLSEKSELPLLCEKHGLIFVGPRPETIDLLGDKIQARSVARAAGVPLVPGTDQLDSVADACAFAKEIGYPVLLKASAGGGGKGMVIAHDEAELKAGYAKASAEALAAFGDGRLFMECFIAEARHVEVQIVGDGEGKVIHFGERDCSVQRRYQKLIEEAPCAAMNDELRRELHQCAVNLAKSVRYRNAGTVEFLFDVLREKFYFIEVNARIQVEHPVSECITGQDLVQWQLKVAGGEPLSLQQADVTVSGHAIECRINAEDPDNGFFPVPGTVVSWNPPQQDGIRLDTHMMQGAVIPPNYDSMVGKLIAYGKSREEAIERLKMAIDHFDIEGIKTTLPLHRKIIEDNDYAGNQIHTRWLEQQFLPHYNN